MREDTKGFMVMVLTTRTLLQDDILFLYKAMEALVSSDHPVNPLVASTSSSGGDCSLPPTSPVGRLQRQQTTITTATAKGSPLLQSNGGLPAPLVPERRQQSLSDCRSNGSLSYVNEASLAMTSSSSGGGASGGGGGGGGGGGSGRRHSLPPINVDPLIELAAPDEKKRNGCVIVMPLENERHKEEDEEEELVDEEEGRTSETAALTEC